MLTDVTELGKLVGKLEQMNELCDWETANAKSIRRNETL